MKRRISLLTLLVLGLALVAFAASFILLFHPVGNTVVGSAESSNAVSASLALIIATIGLVIALYVQSAEYRRETEIVDGLQEARILLELMVSRVAVAQGGGRNSVQLKFEKEKEQLIETLKGPAGRFLNYIRITKDTIASQRKVPESWRLLYLHTGNILNAEELKECAADVVGLLGLLNSVSGADVHKYANYVISVDSIDALNAREDIIVRAFREVTEKRLMETRRADIDAGDLAGMIDALRRKLRGSEQGEKALQELEASITKAKDGDREAAAYIASLYETLVKSD